MNFPDLLGLAGAVIVIVAYFCNQRGWLASQDWRFPAANLLGAILILASLFKTWNLPSAIIEGFWIAISLYGLVRSRGRQSLDSPESRVG